MFNITNSNRTWVQFRQVQVQTWVQNRTCPSLVMVRFGSVQFSLLPKPWTSSCWCQFNWSFTCLSQCKPVHITCVLCSSYQYDVSRYQWQWAGHVCPRYVGSALALIFARLPRQILHHKHCDYDIPLLFLFHFLAPPNILQSKFRCWAFICIKILWENMTSMPLGSSLQTHYTLPGAVICWVVQWYLQDLLWVLQFIEESFLSLINWLIN